MRLHIDPQLDDDGNDDADKESVENGDDGDGDGRDKDGRFTVGNRGGPGRPPGSSNRIGADFKQLLWDTLMELGGVKWLKDLPPLVLAGLLGKLLPRETMAPEPAAPAPANQAQYTTPPEIAERVARLLDGALRERRLPDVASPAEVAEQQAQEGQDNDDALDCAGRRV